MLLLVDLDGVVYRGALPVPGVAAVLAARHAAGDRIAYVTNNSIWHRSDYESRLRSMGAPVVAGSVVSAPRAAALHVAALRPAATRVLVVGGPGLQREMEDVGLEVVTIADAVLIADAVGVDGYAAAGRPDVVAVGLDEEFTYRRLWIASDAVRAGALLLATNRDPILPIEGAVQPGAGSIVAALEVASGKAPLVIGKPMPHLLEEAARFFGEDVRRAIMIGDGILTDIPAAHAAGARSILMLTGVTTRDELALVPEPAKPHFVAADAAELAAILDTLSVEAEAGA